MKKINNVLGLSFGLVLSVGALVALAPKSSSLAKATNASELANVPAEGDVDQASYFTNSWYNTVGARRISDRAVVAADVSGWGRRGKVGGRKFDVASFSITYDVSALVANSGIVSIFGTDGAYPTSGAYLTFDILKSKATENLYMTTVSCTPNANNGHAKSIDGYYSTPWAEDGNFTGVPVTAEDGRITISFNKINDSETKITTNGVDYIVSTSTLFQNFGTETTAYFSAGIMNNDNTRQAFIIEQIGDASDTAYFSAQGKYGKTKAGLTEINASTLDSAEKAAAAKEKFDALPYAELYNWDKAYLGASYNDAASKIEEATRTYGNQVTLSVYEQKVTAFETAVATLETPEQVQTALNAMTECDTAKEAIDVTSLTSEQKSKYDALVAKYETAVTKLLTAMEAVYEQSVARLESIVSNLASNKDVADAYAAKDAIPTHFSSYLATSKVNSWTSRVDAAMTSLGQKTVFTHNNWDQGNNAPTIVGSDGSLQVVSFGQSMGQTTLESSGLFNKEKIYASDFDLTLKIDSLPEANGAWISFGIMEKPEMWVFADDDSVQDNKGIFFLVTRVTSSTASVQAFLCSMTSNRFYDSPLNQTITVPLNQDIQVSFKEVTKTIAGLSDIYFEMSFNGVSFDQESVAAKKIKTILGASKEGYFFACSNGYSQTNPALFTLKTINGVPANAQSIAKEVDKTPTSTDTEKNFKQGTTNNVNFNLETNGLDLAAVKIDNTALTSTEYSYTNGRLTIQNSALKKLSVGDHIVKAETSAGSVQWTLHVIAGQGDTSESQPESSEETPTTPTNKGCGGSILAASGVVALLSVAGIAFASLKKKEDK